MAKFILDGQEYGGSSSGGSKIVKLTQAEYNALPNDKLSDNTIYIITDSDELSAKNLSYDGFETGLGNNVQDAIDVLNNRIESGVPGESVMRTESGTLDVESGTYGAAKYFVVSFAITFDEIPTVIVSPDDSYLTVTVTDVTEGGFRISVVNRANSDSSRDGVVTWNATGLSSNSNNVSFIFNEDGSIQGYKTAIGGADTVFPFKRDIFGTAVPVGKYLKMSWGANSTISDLSSSITFVSNKEMIICNVTDLGYTNVTLTNSSSSGGYIRLIRKDGTTSTGTSTLKSCTLYDTTAYVVITGALSNSTEYTAKFT